MPPADELCRSFLDLWYHFDPVAGTLAGLPEHDGRLGPWDEAGLREHTVALRALAGAAEDLEVEELADEIDRTALLDHLRVQLFRLERETPHRRNPALWVEHACLGLHALLLRTDAAAGPQALTRLAGLPAFFSSARDTLAEPPLLLVETALAQLDALSPLVEECGRRFGGAWLEAGDDATEVLAEAEGAVDRLRLALRTELAPQPDGAALGIGEAQVDLRLHHEHASAHNAGELWRHANAFAAEIEREVVALAAAVDPRRPWRDVYESVRDDGIVAGDLLAAWDAHSAEALAHARATGLVDEALPALGAAEAPGFAEVLEPVAEYRPAGVTPSAAAVLSAPARVEDEPTADWYRGEHDRHRLAWLAVRLGPPGRHLLSTQRSLLDRMVRREIAASSTLFGFGLAGEARMAERGYLPDPRSQLAQRVLLLRDAHLAVVDLGVHTGQLGAAEAIAYLGARVPVDQRTATADVRRLACRPTEAAAAMLGRRGLLRLEADARRKQGGAFDEARHRREVASYGGLPVPLIRWGMDLDG